MDKEKCPKCGCFLKTETWEFGEDGAEEEDCYCNNQRCELYAGRFKEDYMKDY